MYGHVIAHGKNLAVGIVNGTGIIAAFFYVGRKCGAPKDGAHFFGDGVEDIFEYFQPCWVGFANRFTHKIFWARSSYFGVNNSWP